MVIVIVEFRFIAKHFTRFLCWKSRIYIMDLPFFNFLNTKEPTLKRKMWMSYFVSICKQQPVIVTRHEIFGPMTSSGHKIIKLRLETRLKSRPVAISANQMVEIWVWSPALVLWSWALICYQYSENSVLRPPLKLDYSGLSTCSG
jgi:hypothetical protein